MSEEEKIKFELRHMLDDSDTRYWIGINGIKTIAEAVILIDDISKQNKILKGKIKEYETRKQRSKLWKK